MRIKLSVYPKADDFNIVPSETGCAVRYSQPTNKIVFQSRWLDREARLGNRTTYSHVVDLCDKLLADLALRVGVAGRIREVLLRDIANPQSLEAIAELLGSTERSLRRALEKQELSFRGLRDELRTQLALEYLRSTKLTNDDIAGALGFADGTAFRRAFQRWTGKTPGQIRGILEAGFRDDGRILLRSTRVLPSLQSFASVVSLVRTNCEVRTWADKARFSSWSRPPGP